MRKGLPNVATGHFPQMCRYWWDIFCGKSTRTLLGKSADSDLFLFKKKKWQFFGVLLVRDFEFVTRAWTDTHTHMQACTRSERKTNACARTCSPSLLHTQTLLQIKTHPLPRPCAYNFLDILSICGARSLSLLLFLFLRPFFTMFFSPSLLLSPSLASSHTGWSVGWILHVLCNRYDSKLTWQLRNCIYCRCPICPNPEA